MGKIKGFLFAVRHREILMTDLGLMPTNNCPIYKTEKRNPALTSGFLFQFNNFLFF